MSGTGQRFIDAGYKDIKPLIPVDGKPVIGHVVGLFPGENNFTFICNRDHLERTPLRDVLDKLVPGGRVVGIDPHKKGPVYAVSQVFDAVDDDDEVIVNYCDFAKYWDYRDFLAHTRGRRADGAVTAYRGFHPHMTGTTNYAFMRHDRQWMLEIREKRPFTDNRMMEYASDGTYYFRTGAILKHFTRRLLDEGPDLNGEYYVSLVYNKLISEGLKVSIYEIQHMLQWGEPKDLEDYRRWSGCFTALAGPLEESFPEDESINLIPLAGRGQRFQDAGYRVPKPLIEVSGLPMIVQASECLPPSKCRIFICRADHAREFPLERILTEKYPAAYVLRLDEPTEGQACTCELGLLEVDPDAPLLIGACDNGMLWNRPAYQALIDDPGVDCIVWTFRRFPGSARNPRMYGWVKVDGCDTVTGVSVKEPVSDDPFNDHAIIGTFYFRKTRYFQQALDRLYAGDIRVNNEFYVDSCINEVVALGLRAVVFEVDYYIGWGTPVDLEMFEYWQSFFHKCPGHPYRLENDPRVAREKRDVYDQRYRRFRQENR
jgi:NDP-sugar pyrophosphorylase family protein